MYQKGGTQSVMILLHDYYMESEYACKLEYFPVMCMNVKHQKIFMFIDVIVLNYVYNLWEFCHYCS